MEFLHIIPHEGKHLSQKYFIFTERLKFGLLTEIKTCTHRIGQVLKKKYRREMDYVYAVINEMGRLAFSQKCDHRHNLQDSSECFQK